MKSISYSNRERMPLKAKNMLDKLVIAENSIDYRNLYFTGGNSFDYDFRSFKSVSELFKSIYNGHILIPAAAREQDDFEDRLNELKKYTPREGTDHYVKKEKFLNNVEKFYDGSKLVIEAFKKRYFHKAMVIYFNIFQKT